MGRYSPRPKIGACSGKEKTPKGLEKAFRTTLKCLQKTLRGPLTKTLKEQAALLGRPDRGMGIRVRYCVARSPSALQGSINSKQQFVDVLVGPWVGVQILVTVVGQGSQGSRAS